MRDRIEQVGDILLAAAHADHHVEAAEIDKIEEILKEIWRAEAPPEQEVRRVAEFRQGESVDAGELARLGSMLRDLQPREELPAALQQRLADFDPASFDMDEAVGPFRPDSVEVKRRLLELAVAVHESDGELDFAEDTFIRELGYKLGLQLEQFNDLLLEFLPGDAADAAKAPPAAVTTAERPPLPEPVRPLPEPGANGRQPAAPEETGDAGEREDDWAKISEVEAVDRATYESVGGASDAVPEARELGSDAQTELLVPPSGGEPGNLLAPSPAERRPPRSRGTAARAAARKETAADHGGEPRAATGTPVSKKLKAAATVPAAKKAKASKKTASKKSGATKTPAASKKKAVAKKKPAKKKAAAKKAPARAKKGAKTKSARRR